MKYFIDSENNKVELYSVATTVDGKNAICYDVNGKEYNLPLCAILDDDEEDFVAVPIPIEFPKTFVPSAKFDEDRCIWCPFYSVEEGIGCYCDHKYYEKENGCPIRKYFVEK